MQGEAPHRITGMRQTLKWHKGMGEGPGGLTMGGTRGQYHPPTPPPKADDDGFGSHPFS